MTKFWSLTEYHKRHWINNQTVVTQDIPDIRSSIFSIKIDTAEVNWFNQYQSPIAISCYCLGTAIVLFLWVIELTEIFLFRPIIWAINWPKSITIFSINNIFQTEVNIRIEHSDIYQAGGPYGKKLYLRSWVRYILKTKGTVFSHTDWPSPVNNIFIFFLQ